MPGRASTDRSPDRSNRLGQPFLASRQIAARLVADAGVHADDRVVDFGAGTGVLTAALARAAVGVHEGPPLDLLGATWAPWWRFARGRRLPAASFDPRPAVDAAVLEITRRPAPLVDPALFDRYAAFVREGFGSRADAPRVGVGEWVDRFRARS